MNALALSSQTFSSAELGLQGSLQWLHLAAQALKSGVHFAGHEAVDGVATAPPSLLDSELVSAVPPLTSLLGRLMLTNPLWSMPTCLQ